MSDYSALSDRELAAKVDELRRVVHSEPKDTDAWEGSARDYERASEELTRRAAGKPTGHC